MKKGYTLIEIIIVVTLVLIVGVSATFFVINKKDNNELETVTNKILKSANLYVKTELDENGEKYNEKVINGAKGVQIPLKKLVSKGYIKEEDRKEIYKEKGTPEDGEDYYIMFLQGSGEETNYCDDGSTVIIASWTINENDEIYLCDYEIPVTPEEPQEIPYKNLIDTLLENMEEVPINDEIDGSDYILGAMGTNANNSVSACIVEDDGLFRSGHKYYYRGAVSNNYVSLAGNLFRILNFDSSSMKLISESNINTFFSDKTYYNNNASYISGFNVGNFLGQWRQDFITKLRNDEVVNEITINGVTTTFYENTYQWQWGMYCNSYDSCVSFADSPIGLLTPDEVKFAGGPPREGNTCTCTFTNSWLNSGGTTRISGSTFLADKILSYNNYGCGQGYGCYTSQTRYEIRPVISVHSRYTYIKSGKGTKNDPYILVREKNDLEPYYY